MTGYILVKKKDVTIVGTVSTDLLFAPTGSVRRFTNQLQRAVLRHTIEAAPAHNYAERPLRPHPGPTLKESLVPGKVLPRKYPQGTRLYGSVGSTAGHALYVDKGTGIHGGNGPYPARILPPWAEGSPSLYEASWKPGHREVAPVYISGQVGKEFFDKGLRAGMRAMKMLGSLSAGGGRVGEALRTWPQISASFVNGNTQGVGGSLRLQLWRSWRAEAWGNRRYLGHGVSHKEKRDIQQRRYVQALKDSDRRKTVANNVMRDQKLALAAGIRRREAEKAAQKRRENAVKRAQAAAEREAKAAERTAKNEVAVLSNRAKIKASALVKELREQGRRNVKLLVGQSGAYRVQWRDSKGRVQTRDFRN